MSTSGEAADQTVRLSLDGAETVIRLSGDGAKGLVKLIADILADHKADKLTSGKQRLKDLLRSGKKLEVYTVDDENLKRFCQEAKTYGISYTLVKRENNTGVTEILAKAEDKRRINHIFELFGQNDVAQDGASFGETVIKRGVELRENGDGINPSRTRTASRVQSVTSSRTSERATKASSDDRPSVRKKLADIHAEHAHSGEAVRQTAKKVKNAAR